MFGGQLKPAGQRNFGKSIPSNIEQNPRKSVARERSMSRDRVNQNGGGRAMSIERTRTRGESRERPRRAESRRRESRAESKDRTRDRSEDRYDSHRMTHFLNFGSTRLILDAVWQCQYAVQNRDRDVNHRMIVTSEMIVTFQLIEKREEEIDLKIVRNGDVIEGKAAHVGTILKDSPKIGRAPSLLNFSFTEF